MAEQEKPVSDLPAGTDAAPAQWSGRRSIAELAAGSRRPTAKPREHQLRGTGGDRAVGAPVAAVRGQVIMACGTGKTFDRGLGRRAPAEPSQVDRARADDPAGSSVCTRMAAPCRRRSAGLLRICSDKAAPAHRGRHRAAMSLARHVPPTDPAEIAERLARWDTPLLGDLHV